MNVEDLIRLLGVYPPGMQVVMSSDIEGNSHSPLAVVAETMYYPDTTYSGDTYPTSEEIASSKGYYTEEDEAPDGAYRVVCLWPVN